jgi:hypothetical protein
MAPIYRRRFFTDAEIIRARALRLDGMSWKGLGVAFDCDYATIRRVIEPGYSEFRARQIADTRGARLKSLGQREAVVSVRKQIPEYVLTDRERRQTAPQTLTSLLCGDPAPGQSALDKRGQPLA